MLTERSFEIPANRHRVGGTGRLRPHDRWVAVFRYSLGDCRLMAAGVARHQICAGIFGSRQP